MAKIWKLRRYHYTLAELQRRALSYFDKNPQKWTYSQRGAAVALKQMFKAFAVMKEDYKTITPAQMRTCIYLVGRVFFMDSLSNVKFEWHDDGATWAHNIHFTAVANADRKTDSAIISFNLSHPKWQHTPANKRPKKFVGTLVHECVHIYLGRHSPNRADGATGHGTAWHVISEAVERRAAEIFGTKFHLNRPAQLLYEHEESGEIGLSQEELRSCFGELFWYSPVTNALFNMGELRSDMTDEQAETCEPNRPAMIELDVFSYEVTTYWRD